MSENKGNPVLTVIVAIAVPVILFMLASDIINSFDSRMYQSRVMFGWIIYIIIVGVFEYFWLTRD